MLDAGGGDHYKMALPSCLKMVAFIKPFSWLIFLKRTIKSHRIDEALFSMVYRHDPAYRRHGVGILTY
jgi:hypothetical protein